jgi:uncharacterized membrane protein
MSGTDMNRRNGDDSIKITYKVKKRVVIHTVLTSVILQIVFAVLLFFNIDNLLNYLSGFIIVIFMLVIIKHLKQMQITYGAVISNNYVQVNGKKFFFKDYDFYPYGFKRHRN